MKPTFQNITYLLLTTSILSTMADPCLGAATTRVSVNSSNLEGSADSNFSSISADGRYVAFSSSASNLVTGDTNGVKDVFIRDLLTGQTSLVSVDSSGLLGNGDSWNAAISADAKFVAFTSNATNLVSGDTNGFQDVFIRNIAGGTTMRISVSSAGMQGNFPSDSAAISADGDYVAFDSWASTLVPGDTNGQRDIFVRNTQNGNTERLSIDSAEQQVAGYSEDPSISANGRFVAFMSKGETLITGDTNGRPDIFVRDRLKGTTSRASVDSAGVEAGNWSQGASISADGNMVAFTSKANNLVLNDTNGTWDAFVHNRATGKTTRVSVDSTGLQANSYTTYVSISPDGRTIAFESPATNLVTGDTNALTDVFVYDLPNKKTVRASASSTNLQSDGTSEAPTLSADGRLVAFTSLATNLVQADTNSSQDVFIRDKLANDAKNSDIAVSMSSSQASVAINQTATYTFSVSNNGPDSANSLALINIISHGSIVNASATQGNCTKATISVCRLGTLAPGANAVVTVSIKADSGNNLTQQLSAYAAAKDPEPLLNNHMTVMTPITP